MNTLLQKRELPGAALVATLLIIPMGVSIALGITVKEVMLDFNYQVLVILIVMELFTNLIAESGVMEKLAVKLAVLSKGKMCTITVMFGMLIFLISSVLNNITAIMVLLPVIFVLLKALEVRKKEMFVFFSTLLALSNTGGMASPIGDLPAVVIMTSGVTTFTGYLFRAFPLALLTSIVIVAIMAVKIGKDEKNNETKIIAVDFLQSQYKHRIVKYDVLIPLLFMLMAMMIAWSVVPQSVIPPEVIAIAGYAVANVISSIKGVNIKQTINMKAVLTIAAFLFLATVISHTGVLEELVAMLQAEVENPKTLIIVIMLLTSIISGFVSAGPAAAAMMPVIINLCNTVFAAQADWIAIAYAASICAGSSMFLWSATAGFILSGKVNAAHVECNGKHQGWGVKEYLKYGFVMYAIQMTIAIAVIAVIL